ncbi:MAG: UvrD-helicase domain-containing protein [Clostridia bacterium]|nr:UvrD-helicase domain-containing protein [Clostridia bacterium]
MDYQTLRKQIIEKDFSNMNDRQFEAVTTVNGPLLILAGAGSGKTTVLINRIAYLVRYGNAYQSIEVPYYTEADLAAGQDYLDGKTDTPPQDGFSVRPPKPWEILAITFTNKAAGELRERIDRKLGEGGADLWAGTFHSVCGRILRRYADRVGFSSHFTIYDTDDQRRLMKQIMKDADVDEKMLPHRSVLSAISSAKDSLISPQELMQMAGSNPRQKMIAELYRIYVRRLQEADAMDFDDMIVYTVKLLRENDDVREYYANRFRYVMVDEYQDTNHAQYVLIGLLAGGGNLCVVGDDDQSIYRFRGATIENILHFEEDYPGAKIIRLEQNYRSTANILNAANAVIKNNIGRKGKTLWTESGDGDKIAVYNAADEKEEAKHIADDILEQVGKGGTFSQHAVLYRMNAQSAALENVFARSGITYKVIGGFRFFERKEIKDILAYLNVVNNHQDGIRLRRIINEPKRGIGETTVNRAAQVAEQNGISLFEIFSRADEFALLSRAAAKLQTFCQTIDALSDLIEDVSLSELVEQVLEQTGYRAALQAENTEEAKDRLENVMEFVSTVKHYEEENEEPTLSGFLEEISLVSDTDSLDENDDAVVMMTVHAAKGLEFDRVYLVGWEEGIFPGNQSIYGGPEELEEERRLAYVAITRAKKHLSISHAATRMLFGQTGRNLPSRFLKEIPPELCEENKVRFSSTVIPVTESKKREFSSGFGTFSSVKQPSAPAVAYTAGQTVEHKTFGVGMIVKATPMSSDTMLEIAFEKVGTKKLMANFAKLKVLS